MTIGHPLAGLKVGLSSNILRPQFPGFHFRKVMRETPESAGFWSRIHSATGAYAGVARRHVHLVTPSGHRPGRLQARHAHILQIGFRLAIAQADARSAMPISFRLASVWSSPRQTPGPPCPYRSDRPPSGHRQGGRQARRPYPSDWPPSGHRLGSRQARHAHILDIGLSLVIAQADASPVMPISLR